jgi:demethylmenaquinone methyltransferase/2-methoxy-6-polyprenyl-1,4-benzoquinol methylase
MIPFNHLGWLFSRFASMAYPDEIRRDLCRMLAPAPEHAALLDLGAGTGVLSGYAHSCRKDLRLIAVDPAEGMLRYAPHYVRTVNARAEALPFESAAFDIVVVGEALHHFQEPYAALGEIARVLKGGGSLFIYDFDPGTFQGGFICRAEKLLGEPGNFFPPETISTMLEEHGFSVRYARYRWRYTLCARLRPA